MLIRLTWLWVLCTAAAVCAVAMPATADGALRPVAVKHSLLGTHYWYAQTYRGHDVIGGFLAIHEYSDGRRESDEGRRLLRGEIPDRPAVSRSRAAEIARAVRPDSRVANDPTLAVLPKSTARLVWSVVVKRPTGHERVLVDASSGEVLRIDRLAVDANGSGRVFDPNPVATLRNQSLLDQDDTDYPALAAAYRNVSLTHLDGSGFLRGDYADAKLVQEFGLDAAFSSTLSFGFDRSSPFFEQVMSYYQVTRAQEYIQSLGFSGLNNEPQRLLPNLFPFDNSFFDPFDDVIAFGTGGVDDAEDADVIWHEYGHAMQFDQIAMLIEGSNDLAAIGEGFGDYWAVTMSQPVNGGYEVPCVGDWDAIPLSTFVPHCLRRVDTDLTVEDRIGEPHHDGQIWSRALWDVNQALGRDVASRIVLEAQYAYSPTMTFSQAAVVTVATAKQLYDQGAARIVADAFAARGIRLREPPPLPPRPYLPLAADVVATIGDPAPGGGALAGDFEPGSLNLGGAVSFNADLLVDGELGEGAFVAYRTQVSELARSGGAAPGGDTYGPGTLGRVVLNDAGDVAFSFLFDPLGSPFGSNAGLFLRPATASTPLQVVVPDSTPAPGGGAFRGAFEAALNGGGQIAFTGLVDSDDGYVPGVGSGVYIARTGGAIATIAEPGDTTLDGEVLDHAAGPSINAAADVAFSGHISTDPHFCLGGFLDCIASVFLRRADSGAAEVIARQGTAVPGDEESTYAFAYKPVLNGNRDVVYFAQLQPSFDSAIFLRRRGATEQIVRDFQAVPNVGTVLVGFPTFRAFLPDYAVNNRGQVALRTYLFDEQSGEIVGATWIWEAGKLRLLARAGTSVPGVGTIAHILEGIHLNDRGQVLLDVVLADGRRALLRTR